MGKIQDTFVQTLKSFFISDLANKVNLSIEFDSLK